MQSNSGIFLILGAALLWGTTGTAQSFAPAGFDPTVIGFLRLLIGGIALLGLAAFRRELGRLSNWSLRPLLLAALFTASYQVCFFAAVKLTGVAVGTIVGIGSAPIAGGLLGFLFRGERPRRRWWLATLLAICGCALLSLGGESLAVDPLGILLAVGAGSSYAIYTLVIKGMLETRPANAVMALVTCIGAIFLAPLLIGRELTWLAQPRAILVALHLGLMTMALAYWFFARGLQRVEVGAATTLSLAEPMTAGLLGILLLGEPMTAQALSGIALIFGGLALLVLPVGRVMRRLAGSHP